MSKADELFEKIIKLPLTSGSYYKKEDSILEDSVVVECCCNFHIYNDLKISKLHGA